MKVEFYVSPQGNDGNKGDLAAPFQTLERARDAAQKVLESGAADGELRIYLREGEYERTDTFELLKAHSGTKECPIVYSSYNGEQARITGGKTIDARAFVPVTDPAALARIRPEAQGKVLCVDLKAQGLFDYGVIKHTGFALDIVPSAMELFVNDSAPVLARFPKNGQRIPLGKIVEKGDGISGYHPDRDPFPTAEQLKGGVIEYDYPEADRWGGVKNAFAFGYFDWGFGDDHLEIECIDTEKKQIQFKEASICGLSHHSYYNSYYVYNLLEELSEPGEYYIDREAGMLYYCPEADFSENAKVQLSLLEVPMVAMEDAQHIRFEGITFENSRGMAVYSQNCAYTKFERCTFRNLGMVAISYGLGFEEVPVPVHNATLKPAKRKIGGIKAHQWDNLFFNRQAGHDNIVLSCHIYNTGAGGVILDGGDRESLTPGNSHVVGCEIHHFNRIDTCYRPGVRLMGVGNTVCFNRLHDAPQQCIEQLGGNDTVIAYNEIYRCCLDNYDNGAIYIGSKHPSTNSFNTQVLFNYFHHNCSNNHFIFGKIRSETYDLYLDGHPGTTIYGNIFANSDAMEGTFINVDAMYDVVRNNIYVNESAIYHHTMYDRDLSYDPFCFFSAENAKIWKERYPLMENYKKAREIPCAGHTFANNIHVGRGHMLRGADTVYHYENNFHFDTDPGFVDMEGGNFKLKEGSRVFVKNPEFKNIPTEYIGNFEAYRKDHPEK